LTFLTSFFLHGGIIHLASNLYFLVVFGEHVEDYLGRWRWLLLVLLSAIAGDYLTRWLTRTRLPLASGPAAEFPG
jgi:membrane associated rhomboid family serine protease